MPRKLAYIRYCKLCGIQKPATFFYKAVPGTCKECHKIWRKNYYRDNKDRQKEQMRLYNIKNPEIISKCIKKYYMVGSGKSVANTYVKYKYKTDTLFKLRKCLRNRLLSALKSKNWQKNSSLKEYAGCSLEELKSYLESKFDSNMTWENHGSYWHIDHIVPLSNAKTEEEMYKLCHYTNLQPLEAMANIKKGNKILDIL